jgi:hypothetical protein
MENYLSMLYDALTPSSANAFTWGDLETAAAGGTAVRSLRNKLSQGKGWTVKSSPETQMLEKAMPFLRQYPNPFLPIKDVEFTQTYGSSYSPSKDRATLSPFATDIVGGPSKTLFPQMGGMPRGVSFLNDLFHEGTHGLQKKGRSLENRNTRGTSWLPSPGSPKEKSGEDQGYWQNPTEVQARAIGTLAAITGARQRGVPMDELGLMKEAYVPGDYWPEAKVLLAAILAGHDPMAAQKSYQGGGITPFGNLDYRKGGW